MRMRKLFSFNMVSLDGYFEGATKWDLSWHHVDNEFNEFAIVQLNEIGTLLFGRLTYEGMASYWSSPEAARNDPEVAGLMNKIPKMVFSKTLSKAGWNSTRLVKDNIADEILNLKQQSEKDMALFGSANLMSSLMRMDLLDEHRVMVNPVVLGAGTPLFQTKDKLNLKLSRTRTFGNGNVLLCYEPDGK